MKKIHLFIALAIVAGLSVSCKKNNHNRQSMLEPAALDKVESSKAGLADDVLTALDDLAQSFVDEAGHIDVSRIITTNLSEEEKLQQPDFLLDPALTHELITKSQKVAALAFLVVERGIRVAYGMPVKASDESIVRLTADLNHPISVEDNKNLSMEEKTRKTYEQCKERGELLYFWQFSFALQTELKYLIACCPEPFFRNLSEEEYIAFNSRYQSAKQAVIILSEYDSEMKAVYDCYKAYGCFDDSEEADSSLEAGKAFYPTQKEAYAARRAAMLK